jgi:cell division protein FtsA
MQHARKDKGFASPNMTPRIVTGIDLGTHSVRALITQFDADGRPNIIGKGIAESRGITKGYITSVADAAAAVRAAVRQAEAQAGTRIAEAYIGIGGIGLEGVQVRGEATASRADGIFTENEIDRCESYARDRIPEVENKVVIYYNVVSYTIDEKPTPVTDPVGMKGLKLGVTFFFATVLKQHYLAIGEVMKLAGIDPLNFYPTPLATSIVALGKKQMAGGALLADIGAETLSTIIFEGGKPLSMEVFDIGSSNLTSELAQTLHISLDEADEIKLGNPHRHPTKKVQDAYIKNLRDIFSLIKSHVKKFDRDRRLPGGILITGGGSHIDSIAEFATDEVDIYATTDIPSLGTAKLPVTDPVFISAYGITLLSFADEGRTSHIGVSSLKHAFETLKGWIAQLTP